MGIINNILRWPNLRSNALCFYPLVTSLFKTYLRHLQFFKKQLATVVIILLFVITPVMAQDGESAAASANNQEKLCKMGVFPFISTQHLEDMFAPIAAQLSEVMGCALRFRSASSFESFMNKLRDGEFDVAFIQPFSTLR